MKYSVNQYSKIFGQLLEKTPKSEHSKAIKEFANMLEQNGDLNKEGDILYAIEKELYEKTGKQKREMTEVKDDPELIGGVKIRIGDTLIDNSIQSRINNLKEAFK